MSHNAPVASIEIGRAFSFCAEAPDRSTLAVYLQPYDVYAAYVAGPHTAITIDGQPASIDAVLDWVQQASKPFARIDGDFHLRAVAMHFSESPA